MKFLQGVLTSFNSNFFRNVTFVRHVSRHGYIPPDSEPGAYPFPKRRIPKRAQVSLQQRLKDINVKRFDDLMQPIDIGLSHESTPQELLKNKKKSATTIRDDKLQQELEYLSRHHKLQIPLSQVHASWLTEGGLLHQYQIAKHYNIYKDLFTEPHFFLSRVAMNIYFATTTPIDDDVPIFPAFYGNVIMPRDAMQAPKVEFIATEKNLWTLVLTCPDEHLIDNDKEYVHWMIVNIPGNNVSQGETVHSYLPPIPPDGTGFHRYAFVLYKQESRIDFSNWLQNQTSLQKKTSENNTDCIETCSALDDRTFCTHEFYRHYEDVLTPASLLFFQSVWDSSVRETYRNVLNMPEPRFEFDWPTPYRAPQVQFPDKLPFNKYLDLYRDVKDLNEEVLKERLKLSHPYKGYTGLFKYPNVIPYDRYKYPPSWLAEKERERNLGKGIWKDMP